MAEPSFLTRYGANGCEGRRRSMTYQEECAALAWLETFDPAAFHRRGCAYRAHREDGSREEK
jgi:hypothetical protein